VSHPSSSTSTLVSRQHACTPQSHTENTSRDSDDPWFMIYDYGFDLSDRIRIVSTVMVLIVVYLFGCVFETILVVTP
jgi:hypothetical protein